MLTDSVMLILYAIILFIIFRMYSVVTKLQASVEKRLSAVEADLEMVKKTVSELVKRFSDA